MMGNETFLAFLDYFVTVMISTIIAIVCTVVSTMDCVKKHKFITSAKILISYWIVWILTALHEIYSVNLGIGFGMASPFSMYMFDHPVLFKAYNFITVFSFLFVLIIPFIVLIHMNRNRHNEDWKGDG